jgi:hypothetical protein
MSNHIMPARAFFIGKVSKGLAAVAMVVALIYPAVLRADVASTAATAGPAAGVPCDTCRTAWITAYASVPEQTSSLGGNRTPIKTLEESCFIH